MVNLIFHPCIRRALGQSLHIPTIRQPTIFMHQRRICKLSVDPPSFPIEAGAQSFDRSLFQRRVRVVAARVPASSTGQILKSEILKRLILNVPKVRSVVYEKGSDCRLVLLQLTEKESLPREAAEYLRAKGAELTEHELEFGYDYWTADEILQSILPEDLRDESPTGFAITGHLAHFNLNKDYLPYKHIIGQVVLDKNKRLRTVVNKLDSIHNQFRFFDMELIAGEPDYIVEHHESNCRFTFDFREVYWNSRLHSEHERLVGVFKPEDGIVADVFAGVGPFAVPAAKKGCAVLANDLNPNSAKWLLQNVTNNNVDNNIRVFCEDGRDFIKSAFRRAYDEPFLAFSGPAMSKRQQEEQRRRQRQIESGTVTRADANSDPTLAKTEQAPPATISTPRPPRDRISHFVMNLPDTSIEFLDAFRGAMKEADVGRDLTGVYQAMPMIHCHCFTRFLDSAEAEADIRERVKIALGSEVDEDVSLHLVRSVAPNKDMYCISFRLPRRIEFE